MVPIDGSEQRGQGRRAREYLRASLDRFGRARSLGEPEEEKKNGKRRLRNVGLSPSTVASKTRSRRPYGTETGVRCGRFVAGVLTLAEEIEPKVSDFLRDELMLELSESKTLITHATSQEADQPLQVSMSRFRRISTEPNQAPSSKIDNGRHHGNPPPPAPRRGGISPGQALSRWIVREM